MPKKHFEPIRSSAPSGTKSFSSSLFTSLVSSKSDIQSVSKSPLTVSSFLDKVTKNEKEELDSMLAKAIYANGSPLSLPDNTY